MREKLSDFGVKQILYRVDIALNVHPKNSRMLKVHGDKLVEVVEAGLLNDQGLRLQWRDLFDSFDIMVRYNILIKVKIICRIYKTVISCDKEQYDYFSFSIFSFIYIFSHISFTSLIKLILLKLFDPTVS